MNNITARHSANLEEENVDSTQLSHLQNVNLNKQLIEKGSNSAQT